MHAPAEAAAAAVAASPTMRIVFKLFASLTDFLPADKRHGNQLDLELAEGTTIEQAIAPFGLPAKLVHLVLVNGRYVEPADRATRALVDGDVLAIWPPIAGG